MQHDDIDRLIAHGNRVEMAKSESRGLLCQVNFKSGNRMTGILETCYWPFNGLPGAIDPAPSMRLRAQAQMKNDAGQPVEAIAEHHFSPDDVECVVLLYPAAQPSSIITRS